MSAQKVAKKLRKKVFYLMVLFSMPLNKLSCPISRLYWTDLKARTIDSINLDGKKRKLIRQFHPKEGKPYKLDVFENNVYFTTYQHNKILKMNKFGIGKSMY